MRRGGVGPAVCADQSGRRVAEQALAAERFGALARRSARGTGFGPRAVGTGRGVARSVVVGHRAARRSGAADHDRRPLRRSRRRAADGVGRYRAAAHRRRGRDADRRALRPDAARAQRSVVGRTTSCRAPTRCDCHYERRAAARDVHRGHSRRRGRRGRARGAIAPGTERPVDGLRRGAAWREAVALGFGRDRSCWRADAATSLARGAAVAALGEAMRIWAAGHLEKAERSRARDRTAGCRHPLYVGSSVIALGVAIAAASARRRGAGALHGRDDHGGDPTEEAFLRAGSARLRRLPRVAASRWRAASAGDARCATREHRAVAGAGALASALLAC